MADRSHGSSGRKFSSPKIAAVSLQEPRISGKSSPERLDEFLHRRRQHAALAVQNGERPGELLPLEVQHGQRALLLLLRHGRLRHDRDAVIDFDRALHRLDVVELHHRLDLELVLAEDDIDRLAGRDVRVEADELLAP
jgi:hypothetical protein